MRLLIVLGALLLLAGCATAPATYFCAPAELHGVRGVGCVPVPPRQ